MELFPDDTKDKLPTSALSSLLPPGRHSTIICEHNHHSCAIYKLDDGVESNYKVVHARRAQREAQMSPVVFCCY